MGGLTMTHPNWIQANRNRGDLRARWHAPFREIDVVLCPPMPTVAFPHDHSPLFARVLAIDGAKAPCALLRPERVGWHYDPERAAGDDGADWPHRQ
jgi:Asp-tRNA(Asn)/Glu-tRNA(Gln) amidotransferase A subunit family amidase